MRGPSTLVIQIERSRQSTTTITTMVDDMPVGGGGGNFGSELPPEAMAPSEKPANADDGKPLPERLVSKAWAVRKEAQEELMGLVSQLPTNCSSELMTEHAPKWAQYLNEPNPGAMEKVLDSFKMFIDKCEPALLGSMQNTVYQPMIDKCMGAAKPTIKTKALECMLLLFEVSENFGEETMDAFITFLKSPKPKTQLVATQLLAALMLGFGIKRFSPARFMKFIEAAANSSAPANRNEAMNCFKAIFQWVGEAGVQPFIEPLKDAQKAQLKKDFEAITAEKKQFKRKTRTEQEAAKQAELDNAINAAMEEDKEEEKIDVFDISAPKEVISKFGPDWLAETLAIKKWNDKRDKLQEVITETDTPKLQEGDYSVLFDALKKMAADNHAVVSQHAIRAIGNLSSGLRKSFHDCALQAVPVLFAKFKEKRIVEDIMTALEKIMMCIEIAEIVEHITKIKSEKTPATKINCLTWLEKAICTTMIDQLNDIVDQLAPVALALSEEKDANLRDLALTVLGVLLARVGDNPMQPFLNNMIPAKMKKVTEAKEAYKITKYDKSERKAAAEAAAAKKKAAAAAKAKPKPKAAAAAAAMDEDSMVAKKPKAMAMTFDNDVAGGEPTALNGGVLNEDEPMKPRGKPPPNIGRKPPSRKKPAEEEKTEGLAQPEPPKRGPPARLAAKAAGAAAGGGKAKTVSAADIQEEDVGSGLSKEEAINKVSDFYDAAHVAKFEDAKWQIKQEGYHGIKAQIEELKPDAVMVEATCKFIKTRMKDWKESNINLIKEAIFTFQTITQHCDRVPKRAVHCYGSFLCDKIGDIKVSAAIKELYLNLSEFCTAKYVSLQVVKNGLSAKAPNNLKESCNFLSQQIEDFGAGRVGVKECIDFAVHCANHANKAVRDAAMALFAVLYKHLGEATRQFLDGVKPATMALIEKEFEKVTPYAKGEFQGTRTCKGEAAEIEQATGGGGKGGGAPDALAALESALPREDISKQLNSKLMKMFTEGDWKIKVKGCETVQGILKDAKMRIQPDGLNDLMDALKNNFKEKNKAVLKQVILLMGSMAEAVGQPIQKWNKKCFVPLLGFLGDKAALMRADVIVQCDKWAEAIGAERVIDGMCTFLAEGNPEMRTECLKWIGAHKDAIKKCEHQAMVKPLILCLTDRSGPIRNMAEEVIVSAMASVGFGVFQEGTKDLKPAVKSSVKPYLDKAKQKCIAANPDAAAADEDMDDSTPAPQAQAAASRPKTAVKAGATKTVTKAPGAAAPKSKLELSLKKNQPQNMPGTSPRSKPSTTASGSQKKTIGMRNTVAPKVSAPFAEAEQEVFTINPGNKERRALADSKSKWMHDDIKPAHIETVKKASAEIFGAETAQLMFQSDFQKHVKVIEKMLSLIQSQPQDLMECVDIIFKWIFIKEAESNKTTFIVAALDFYTKLFEFLIAQNYLLWDHEALIVVPMLCEKAGHGQATIKAKVKALIKKAFEMHDPRKMLTLVIKFGAQSKNLKSASESLDEVAHFLRTQDQMPLGEGAIKTIGKLVDSKDSGVRENALCVLCEIYKVLDEEIWRVVGQVPLKVKGLMEQRFRKVKGLSTSTQAAQPMVRTQQQQKPPSSNNGQSELTKSFNPGLKMQTPRTGIRGGGGQTTNFSEQSSNLARSFRPSQQAAESNLTRSFGNRGVMQSKLNTQRPQTAMNREGFQNQFSQRATIPPPTTDDDFMSQNAPQEPQRASEGPNFHPSQNEIRFLDDDEDIRAQIEEMEGGLNQHEQLTGRESPKRPPLDPDTQRQVDDIMKHIQNLKYSSELNKRVESLIALNEIIQASEKQKEGLQHTANDLINAFTHVLNDIFERPRAEMPLRFAKYFVTIVNKTCSQELIMKVVKENDLYELCEQLLTRLLIDQLDQLGQEKEGEFILKNLNGSMLRCLENCDSTNIFCVLFNLLRRFKDSATSSKLPGLIIKCLLKLSKILEKVIEQLEIERVLFVIHLYLISIDHENKTANDDMGIRIVKTLVHEMVKVKEHTILESYKVVASHAAEDKHLHRWIKIVLNTLDPQSVDVSVSQAEDRTGAAGPDREMAQIIAELRATETFHDAIPKLHAFQTRNPRLSTDYILKDLAPSFQNLIKQNLEQYKNSISETGSTPTQMASDNNPQDRPSFSAMQKASSSKTPASQVKRFGFANTRFQSEKMASQEQNPGSQHSSASIPQTGSQGNLRFPMSSRQTVQGSTGLATSLNQAAQPQAQTQATTAGAATTTSSDRINQYQSKLSSMREKFQQRKTLQQATGDGSKAPSTTKNATGGSGQKLNMSFSAMNSSLQAKWSAVNKGSATSAAKVENAQLASTMVGSNVPRLGHSEVQAPGAQMSASGSQATFSSAANLTRSQNQALQARAGEGGASNQDLNRRLQEMKAKLASLKKN